MSNFSISQNNWTYLSIGLMGGLIIAIGFVLPNAFAEKATTVHISGQVSLTTDLILSLQASAKGSLESLSGRGVDTPFHAGAGGFPPGECTFPLSGSISGDIITLSGVVTQSSNLANIGTPVTIIADASTGAIEFHFGAFSLTGTGNVVIT